MRLLFILAVSTAFFPGALNARQRTLTEPQQYLLDYIGSGKAVPACGVCLDGARQYAEERKDAALKELTRGMALIRGGDYMIGAQKGKGEPDELPRHKVWLDAFYIDTKEAAIGDYLAFVKATGGNHPEWAKPGGKFNLKDGKDKYYHRLRDVLDGCPGCPVFGVLWEDADAYCRWKKKRLPTEAEWEAAAAGGTAAKFSFGDSSADAGDFAWYEANSAGKPHPGGTKRPNASGLYDMHGNVWEWTADYYDKGYYAAGPARNPKGPAAGRDRVLRGGSWASGDDELALTNRASYHKANDDIGFRCALSEKDALTRIKF